MTYLQTMINLLSIIFYYYFLYCENIFFSHSAKYSFYIFWYIKKYLLVIDISKDIYIHTFAYKKKIFWYINYQNLLLGIKLI